jgi:Protein of unknown function (DUF1592)/Protein of unknown function (DUF1588)/Protein of unknown function (DUF1587)/Protein of unknown function (DUF1585)/Ca-dependent carbohydrate-binding module xylan-binding/Protein of unknown function (DUF1595)/Planctomycete cytochrome C
MLLPLLAMLAPALGGPSTGDFEARVRPLLATHCFECHSGAEPKGELALDVFTNDGGARAKPETWKLVRTRLAAGEMPPRKQPRLAPAELDTLLDWIDSVPGAGKARGRTVLRRLNRREYENTVRDLYGIDFDGRERLPADDVGAGFDVLGSVLSLPDSALEKYLAAAEEIAAAAILAADPEHPPRERRLGAKLEGGYQGARDGFRTLSTNGELGCSIVLPREGDYVVRARAFGTQAGPEPARMSLSVGGKLLAHFDVEAVRKEPQVYETRAHLQAGPQRLTAGFLNDYYKPDDPDPKQRDRNLHIEWVEIEGPLDPTPISAFQRAELGGLSAAGLPAAIGRIASRAWRRPAGKAEVEALLALSPAQSQPFLRARAALVGILSSPRFLFRLEPDPAGLEPGSLRRLDGYDLAARLSYFLWSSTPDAELEALAASGEIASDATLERELGRMLEDPRSNELARAFALQWLELEPLERAAPDPQRFPKFDESLRASMRAETEAFFEAVLRERRPLSTLLDADFSFVDERLAQLYGIPGVRGPELRRVRVERGRRGGLLGQASVLTVTSNPTRTSAVKRGKWILEVLLDAPPPPPPPGVGVLEDTTKKLVDASLRERLELHRARPECAVCHDRIDPLGLALENYDVIGSWRESEGGHAIDSSGVLPDGRKIAGRAELVAALLADGALTRSLARHLLVYALGRELGSDDERALRAAVRSLPVSQATLYDVLRAIVQSEPFRTTRVAGDHP